MVELGLKPRLWDLEPAFLTGEGRLRAGAVTETRISKFTDKSMGEQGVP